MKTTFLVAQNKVFGSRTIVRSDEAETAAQYQAHGAFINKDTLQADWDILGEIDLDSLTIRRPGQ